MTHTLKTFSKIDSIEFESVGSVYYKNTVYPSLLLNGPAYLRFDDEDREKLDLGASYPRFAICRLDIVFPNGDSGNGTGCVVSNHHVLTVGHNLFQKKRGGFAKSIRISAGKHGRRDVLVADPCELYVPDTYFEMEIDEYDFGLVSFNDDLSIYSGQCGVNTDLSRLDERSFEIAGYPADLKNGKFLMFHSGRIIYKSPLFYYRIDATGGQSGSGIFVNSVSDGTLIGIHLGFTSDRKYNKGLFLREEVLVHLYDKINITN